MAAEAREDQPHASLVRLYREVGEEAHRLAQIHRSRLGCGRGCPSCCVDGITVFQIEADSIRQAHADLLAAGTPHPEGACAFLDEQGACRIYPHRPYVCRTQGLPLRWTEEKADGSLAELRDICPLNEEGTPIQHLPPEACWTLGPIEGRLACLQHAAGAGQMVRVRLRDLFAGGQPMPSTPRGGMPGRAAQ
jgi:Fe-S-cluster containining protein